MCCCRFCPPALGSLQVSPHGQLIASTLVLTQECFISTSLAHLGHFRFTSSAFLFKFLSQKVQWLRSSVGSPRILSVPIWQGWRLVASRAAFLVSHSCWTLACSRSCNAKGFLVVQSARGGSDGSEVWSRCGTNMICVSLPKSCPVVARWMNQNLLQSMSTGSSVHCKCKW